MFKKEMTILVYRVRKRNESKGIDKVQCTCKSWHKNEHQIMFLKPKMNKDNVN